MHYTIYILGCSKSAIIAGAFARELHAYQLNVVCETTTMRCASVREM